MKTIEEALQVRYIRLQFQLRMTEDTWLPVNKVSALRGGMGEMLLRQNCISDRNCEECGFEDECLVRRTMYSRFKIQPEFMKRGDSIGFVMECENYNEQFQAGDELVFYLTLFGRTIVYFNQFLEAVYQLGQSGLGKEKSKFQIARILNSGNIPIVEGYQVRMKNYQVHTLWDYVEKRLHSFEQFGTPDTLAFRTPVTIKYQDKFIQEFNMEAIVSSLIRRIYMLDCFEGIPLEPIELKEPVPVIISQTIRPVSVKRYSSTQSSHMILKGIKGKLQCDQIGRELLLLLLAGELTHIGKNTRFGFGRYIVINTNGE